MPCISFDYKTLGEAADHDDKTIAIVCRYRWTGVTFAHVVKGKGLADDWLIRQLYSDIQSLGYTGIRLKSDNENAAALVMERPKAFRDFKNVGRTFYEPSVEGQPQTDGVAEKAVRDLTCQVREYKIAFETNLNQPIPARYIIFRWLVPHAADTINMTSSPMAHGGKVPLQRLKNMLP